MQQLHLAFIWHMHQPMYRKPHTHHYMMPWVRLHGTKDYLDMLLLVQKYPRLKHTFNFVPSLLEQLEDYAAGLATDDYLMLSQKPVHTLTAQDKADILASFFDLNWQHMLFPFARYKTLAAQREEAPESYTNQDFLDLTTWFNLAWIDPIHREQRPTLQTIMQKGENFTESERAEVLHQQRLIIQETLPLYRKALQDQQIELTTTPYYHPILPLLQDTYNTRRSRPESSIPRQRLQAPEDVHRHLHKAKSFHQKTFGESPKGLWPSEQSMSPDILEAVAAQGFTWFASSEGILWHSLGIWGQREQGIHPHCEKLYRPYRIQAGKQSLTVVFRDIYLSDWLGFNAWKGDNEAQAHIFYKELKKLQSHLQSKSQDIPYLITIALDGENCWEYYQEDGRIFLETLYALLNADESINSTTVSAYLEQYPAQDTLDHLFPGSWINSDFSTWIGEPTKNKAWDLLITTRQLLKDLEHTLNPQDRADAWEMLDTAEGSDWFWWFGVGHSSRHDAHFDLAFRTYLKGVYELLKQEVPLSLRCPLESHEGSAHGLSTMQASQEGY